MKWSVAVLVCLAASSSIARAQLPASIPVREIGPVEAVSRDSVGFLYGVRELSDGRVLVNDAGARRLLLLDSTLALARVVADSNVGSGLSYGRRPTGIIAYAGDSTLLVDLAARALLVIDPKGAIVRVMSVPRPADVQFMWNPAFGTPGFDAEGRLVYRGWLMPSMRGLEHGTPSTAQQPAIADSAPILRADLDARTVDTLGWVRIPRLRATATPVPGGIKMTPTINPISTIDDWTLLPDGSVAMLRGQDYHVDWVSADGARSSSAKMPFDWKRLTEDEKIAIVDSTRKQLSQQTLSLTGTGSGAAAAAATVPLPNPAMAAPHTMPTAGAPADGPDHRRAAAPDSVGEVPDVVSASELPDYLPPVLRSGSMKAAPDGAIWVLPSTSTLVGGGLVYDVINRRGEIAYRVRLPVGRALIGFGAKGVIYLTAHGSGGTRIERVRLR